MIIGITGGSGSGKTTLLNLIGSRGGLILDCDEIYHGLLRTNAEMLSAIGARFPEAMEEGTLSRKKLGNLVFSDPAALGELNSITHRFVRQAVLDALSENPGLAAIDAIGLFESGLAELCDTTVAVLAPKDRRIQRLMARDGISQTYAESRINAQHSDAWYREKCTHVLENDGTAEAFTEKCLAFLSRLGIMELL